LNFQLPSESHKATQPLEYPWPVMACLSRVKHKASVN
jgi:hypothetical protein